MTTTPAEVEPSGLTAMRLDLLDALSTIPESSRLRVLDYVPETITPPAVVLLPADPWIVPDDTLAHGAYAIAWQVLILNRAGTNAEVTRQVEENVHHVLDALDSPEHSWLIENVSAPDQIEFAGHTTPILTVRVAVTIPARLTKE